MVALPRHCCVRSLAGALQQLRSFEPFRERQHDGFRQESFGEELPATEQPRPPGSPGESSSWVVLPNMQQQRPLSRSGAGQQQVRWPHGVGAPNGATGTGTSKAVRPKPRNAMSVVAVRAVPWRQVLLERERMGVVGPEG
jgi:hypothetical protein